jgi:hypothetical protein
VLEEIVRAMVNQASADIIGRHVRQGQAIGVLACSNTHLCSITHHAPDEYWPYIYQITPSADNCHKSVENFS